MNFVPLHNCLPNSKSSAWILFQATVDGNGSEYVKCDNSSSSLSQQEKRTERCELSCELRQSPKTNHFSRSVQLGTGDLCFYFISLWFLQCRILESSENHLAPTRVDPKRWPKALNLPKNHLSTSYQSFLPFTSYCTRHCLFYFLSVCSNSCLYFGAVNTMSLRSWHTASKPCLLFDGNGACVVQVPRLWNSSKWPKTAYIRSSLLKADLLGLKCIPHPPDKLNYITLGKEIKFHYHVIII